MGIIPTKNNANPGIVWFIVSAFELFMHYEFFTPLMASSIICFTVSGCFQNHSAASSNEAKNSIDFGGFFFAISII